MTPAEVSDCDFGVIRPFQAVAWNPSVPGAKSEDSLLVTDVGPEIATFGAGWGPMIDIAVEGATVERPDVLII